MQRGTRLAAAGAAIFLAGLVVLFPARVAYQWFAPDAVRLAGISGTVWSGFAAEGTLGDLYAGDLRWRIRPLALITGKLGYAVMAEPAGGSFASDVAIAPGGSVHFSDLDARLPLAALSNAAVLAGVEGRVALQFGSLVLNDRYPVRAAGAANVGGLVLSALSASPLGDYRAEFETVDDVVTGRFEDVSGVLDLSGTIELRPDRSYSLSGRVRATPAAPQGVVQQLRFLGSADADGMRSFRFEGRL